MVREINYNNRDNKDYLRTYATTARVFRNGNGDVILDFVEEFIDPLLLKKTIIDEEDQEYSHDENELRIIQERKCSVVIDANRALELAQTIYNIVNSGGAESDDN